jgi:hypothetical protein
VQPLSPAPRAVPARAGPRPAARGRCPA